uniref:Uncharacterized protein n=1 Tax=Rangifer tarandus platyrhynchus TaxID=3082113 RepID=A0ACB0F8V7_RANTA|nr:unnamed protein product [Rangifer tarandus platyrhynchus]
MSDNVKEQVYKLAKKGLPPSPIDSLDETPGQDGGTTVVMGARLSAKSSLNINQSWTQTEPQRVSEPSPELRAQVFGECKHAETGSVNLPDRIGRGAEAPPPFTNVGSPPTTLAPVGSLSAPRPRLLSPTLVALPIPSLAPSSLRGPRRPPCPASAPGAPTLRNRPPPPADLPLPGPPPPAPTLRRAGPSPGAVEPCGSQPPSCGSRGNFGRKEVQRRRPPRHTCLRGRRRRGGGAQRL